MEIKAVSNSLQLLIILCKPNWSDNDIQFIQEHLTNHETALIPLAQRHRVMPLLWFGHQELQLFSKKSYNTLLQAIKENQLNALKAASLQSTLAKVMTENGVKGFFLKGSSLAQRFYRDIAERHVLDLDLFVGESGLKKMADILHGMGYRSCPDFRSFNSPQAQYFLKTHHDLYFLNTEDKNSLPVELHWSLRGPWSSFGLKPKTALNTVDEFLYLCVHGTEHGWFRLKWLMDIPRIILASDLDWQQVSQRAKELKCTCHLEITLLILERLHVINLHQYWVDKIDAEKYSYEINYILKALAADATVPDNDRKRFNYFRYLSKFRSEKWDVSFLMSFMTSQNDWKLLKLPEPLFFMYFLLRPFLWIFRRMSKIS